MRSTRLELSKIDRVIQDKVNRETRKALGENEQLKKTIFRTQNRLSEVEKLNQILRNSLNVLSEIGTECDKQNLKETRSEYNPMVSEQKENYSLSINNDDPIMASPIQLRRKRQMPDFVENNAQIMQSLKFPQTI